MDGGWVGMADVGTSPDDDLHNGSPSFIDSYQLWRSVLAMGTRDIERGSVLWDNSQLWHEKMDVRGSMIKAEVGTYIWFKKEILLSTCGETANGPDREFSISNLLPGEIRAHYIFASGYCSLPPLPTSKCEVIVRGYANIFLRELGVCVRSEFCSRCFYTMSRKRVTVAGV